MARTIDIDVIEDVSAKLYETRVLILATDRFSDEVRAWLRNAPISMENAIEHLNNLETTIGVVLDYVTDAKAMVDRFVDETVANRRKESA